MGKAAAPALTNTDLQIAGLLKTATECDHCKTGPATCQAEQKCQAAVLAGYRTLQYVFAESDTTASLVTGEKDCSLEVRALAIGIEVASVIELSEASGWVAAGLFMTEG